MSRHNQHVFHVCNIFPCNMQRILHRAQVTIISFLDMSGGVRVHLGRCAFVVTYRRTAMRRNMSPTYSAAFISTFTTTTESFHASSLFNILSTLCIIGCIGMIVWLVYRERKRSESHIHTINTSLTEDRYTLEHKISHRTLELVDAQKIHRQELERVAEFGKLSKGLFHDLVGPLSAVSLSVERLAQHTPAVTEETSHALHTALNASRRMASFMEHIRTLMQHPLPSLEHEGAETARELPLVLDLLAYKARVSGVTMSIHHHDHVTLPIHPIRLQQLFLNIISNAIEAHDPKDHSETKEYTVGISITRTDNTVHIAVTDTGRGIPDEYADVILKQPFTTKKTGTGTGLMTVRSIVEQELYGTIHIKNVPNIGTLCDMRIPVLVKA